MRNKRTGNNTKRDLISCWPNFIMVTCDQSNISSWLFNSLGEILIIEKVVYS